MAAQICLMCLGSLRDFFFPFNFTRFMSYFKILKLSLEMSFSKKKTYTPLWNQWFIRSPNLVQITITESTHSQKLISSLIMRLWVLRVGFAYIWYNFIKYERLYEIIENQISRQSKFNHFLFNNMSQSYISTSTVL